MRAMKQIKIAANDDMVGRIIDALRSSAHTGRKGDGIVVVMPIESGFHI